MFDAASKQFARALAYVALSRCTSLEGLYIVGKKLTTNHFKQTFGNEDNVIISETIRLRKFQGNTLTAGFKASCTYKSLVYDPSTQIVFPSDEPEFIL